MTEKTTIKEIIFWLIFLAVAIGVALWLIKFAKDSFVNTNQSIFTKTTQEDLFDGLAIKVPENESITAILKKTKLPNNQERYFAEFKPPLTDDYPIRGSIVLIDEIQYKEGNYIVVPIAANFGGNGEFIYLILLENENENGNLKHLSSMPVGDRIDSISLEKASSKIVFKYKSHHESQAMAEEPFVSTQLYFQIQNDKLIPEATYFNTTPSDVVVNLPTPNSTVGSSFEVNFKAKGWLFEDTSLVKIMSEDYQDLGEAQASSVDGEWMISGLVAIKADLSVTDFKGKAKIILMADNASGLPKKDKKVEYWVYIK